YNPAFDSVADFLERSFTVPMFARELKKLGHVVQVVHPFPSDESFELEGVAYRLVRPAWLWGAAGRVAARLLGGFPYPYYQLATRMVPLIEHFSPDVVHFFGLTLDPNLWLISRWAEQARVPLVVHFHGGQAATRAPRRLLQRHNLQRARRLLFTLREQACSWVEEGLLTEPAKVVELMETSSLFAWRPRAGARAETGMEGNPVFLSAGRLSPEKDPLALLRGFARIRERWPEVHLYLYYLRADMLAEISDFIKQDPLLDGAVHLRGTVPFSQMEAVYNSADFLLQGSLREWSGCTVLEAMSCGVIPIVTDIPTFRRMTKRGHYGRLFPPGDADALARETLAISDHEIPALSAAVRDHFERTFSFPVLAKQLEGIYREVTTQ
ncbi:MAG: glycosyltransferase family 4 protein, partial [Ardenticatenaceae bacterium]